MPNRNQQIERAQTAMKSAMDEIEINWPDLVNDPKSAPCAIWRDLADALQYSKDDGKPGFSIGRCWPSVESDWPDSIERITRLIGPGFHPDTRGADYIDDRGARSFNDSTATFIDEFMESAFKILDDRVYEIAAPILHEMLSA